MQVLVLLVQELHPAAQGSQRGGALLEQRPRRLVAARPLVDHEVIGQAVLAAGVADMDDLELLLVECREEGVAFDVPAHAGEEDPRATRHLHGLLVGARPTDHENLLHVLAGAEPRHGRRHGAGDQDVGGERRHVRRVLARLCQDDVDATRKWAKLLRDGLPRLPAHDHRVRAIDGARGQCCGDLLEVRHVFGQRPRQSAILADAAPGRGGHDHGENLV
mmetsp:Transcript_27904/g.79204  ORF Transcript_27904/g.79204 Transcript_27904/m.79204 type:complete len:219 (+) Transcript_27904:1067-1723(+)